MTKTTKVTVEEFEKLAKKKQRFDRDVKVLVWIMNAFINIGIFAVFAVFFLITMGSAFLSPVLL